MRTEDIDPCDRQSWKQFGTADAGRELVYRLYDIAGQLLYVGITWNPFVRWTYHARTKPWWSEVARADVVQCANDRHAREVESLAIHSEAPLYNIHQARKVVA